MQQPSAPPPKLNLRKLESLQRVLRYAAAVVLAVFVGLIAYSGYKLRQINRQIEEKQARLAGLDEELKKKEAEVADLDKRNEALDTTVEALIDPERPLSDEQAAQVQKTVEENVGDIPSARQIPPRVYIQFARAEQKRGVSGVARRLQAEGFLTPGVSQSRGRMARVTQLSYYQDDEATRADLRKLLEVLRGAGVRLGNPVLVRDASGVRPRHYDLAFGDDFGRDSRPPDTRPTPATEPTREPTPRPTTRPTRRPTPEPTRERTPRPPLEPTPDRGQGNN